MIVETGQSIFDVAADALINPVNCVGVMGAGLALAFKERFPHCWDPYSRACREMTPRPGTLLYVPPVAESPGIICFPTKDDWRDPSRIQWIDDGLSFLVAHADSWGIRSVAIPQLGCGLGGLPWAEVRPVIEKHLGKLMLAVTLCTPQ